MNSRGLCVVSLGDNIGTAFVAMEMMGFNIAEYHGVEINQVARRVADANCGGKQTQEGAWQ